jgi:hypothetical protein
LYEPAIAEILTAMSVRQLINPWAHYQPRLSEKVLSDLDWCRVMLPGDSPVWPADDMNALEEEIRGILDKVRKGNHPPEVTAILVEHLMSMLRAIRDYPIAGAAAAGRSFMEIAATAAAHPRAYTESIRTEEGRKTSRAMAKLRQFAAGIGIVNGLFGTGLKLAELHDGQKRASYVTFVMDDHRNTVIQAYLRSDESKPGRLRDGGTRKRLAPGKKNKANDPDP